MTEPLDLARFNMIQQQIRPFEISGEQIIHLLEQLNRQDFVPESQKQNAYFDILIPLDCGQEMLEPKTEAKILQALDISPTDKILEIGTGSGFLTACLATLGQHVFSYDIHEALTTFAQSNLDAHGIKNVTLKTEDALDHWDSTDLYDVIVLTGAAKAFNEEWKNRLKVGGRLLFFLGSSPSECILVTRTTQGTFEYDSLFDLYAPDLIENDLEPEFDF
ncbi:MAG: protein-L-isoaspartate O-methyltransferase [Methylococcales bacterium]|jgi:protein-L-isoaspartate(D-aspartate) O-methyltransferase|nr:protein-L-isoaspartate O-methyltransferase [Methylococcales bacterium]MBT7443478.1 protein-L-isoaspartate O-methyltransferase [Methylococcales bacterium]